MCVNNLCNFTPNKLLSSVILTLWYKSMTRKLSKKENEILEIISRSTRSSLNNESFESLGINAFDMSLDVNCDRANLSRLLNSLTRNRYLIKILGRPTTFISRRDLETSYPDIFFPEIIDKKTDILSLIKNSKNQTPIHSDHFSQIIGHNKNESLGDVISQIKTSIDYPPEGLPIILYGDPFTGKRSLVQAAINYCVKRKLLKNEKHVYWIDCLNQSNENEVFNLINKFVKNDKDFKLIIIQDFDNLSDISRQRLKSIIINQVIFDYETQSVHSLKAQLFLITKKNMDFINEFHFEQIVPTIVKMPSFDERNLKEKITFILTFFQNESQNINRSIKITRNILNCFALSKFPGNLDHLKVEIKNAILSYLEKPNKEMSIVELDFHHLSDQLLNRINNVNNHIQELESIYDLFNISTVILNPNSECLELRKLLQQEVMISNNEATLSKQVKLESNIVSITQLCKNSMQEAENIKFNTLRLKQVSELYDLITGDLECTSLTKNDHIYFGLLSHLYQVIESLKAKSYAQIYNDDFTSIDLTFVDLVNTLVKKIENHFQVVLPSQEVRFIVVYLTLAKQIEENCRISILVMCRLTRVSESYKKFIKALSEHVQCENFTYNFFDFALKKDLFIEELKSQIYRLNSGKGVLIISDEIIPIEVETILKSISENCLIMPNITIPKIERIVNTCQTTHVLLDDFVPFIDENENIEFTADSDNFNIMDLIQNELLGKSLTFLNPQKITYLAFEVLAKIIKNLDITYTDILAIRFISHTAYMCERVIRGDQLGHKKINEFINQNGKYLHIIENHFSIINDAFGIIIPQSELIYLTELFLDFM